MCGRFTLTSKPKALADLFSLPAAPDFLKPRYNVAPTQTVPVVGLKPDGATRGLLAVRWGLVPADSNGPKGGPLLHNARAETVDRLPSFRDGFRRKRCLVPADGFYEWQTVGKKKHPHHFRLRDRSPFASPGCGTRGATAGTGCCPRAS